MFVHNVCYPAITITVKFSHSPNRNPTILYTSDICQYQTTDYKLHSNTSTSSITTKTPILTH